MMSKEFNLSMVVDSILDMEVLFKNLSPTVRTSFDETFESTEYCKLVENVHWPSGEPFVVLGKSSSYVNESWVNK